MQWAMQGPEWMITCVLKIDTSTSILAYNDLPPDVS